MHRVRASIRTWRFAALAALILCAQAFALLHEFNHDAGNETGRCTVCSIGGSLKHIAAAPESAIPETPHSTATPDATPILYAQNGLPRTTARAPPHHS